LSVHGLGPDLSVTYASTREARRGAHQYGGYTLGGLLLGAGFGVYADRTLEEDGDRSARVITGITLAVLAVIGAVLAVLFWVL
jgi:hypothetical protein